MILFYNIMSLCPGVGDDGHDNLALDVVEGDVGEQRGDSVHQHRVVMGGGPAHTRFNDT